MAERIEAHQVTVPPGTAIAAPQTTALPMNPAVTRRIEIVIPPGPSGLVGFRLAHSGQVIIPFTATNWIVADSEKLDWPVDGYPTGDRWTLVAYNLDIYSHTIYLRWHVDEIPSRNNVVLPDFVIE
jgi:hypothetical protein